MFSPILSKQTEHGHKVECFWHQPAWNGIKKKKCRKIYGWETE